MIGLIMLGAMAWFYGVDVDEFWYKYDTVPREVGGWTHSSPYKTKAECEKARSEVGMMYVGSTHWYRYKPTPCRLDSVELYERRMKELYERLMKYETEQIRRRR